MDTTHPHSAPRAAPARYRHLVAGLLAGIGLAIALPSHSGNTRTPGAAERGLALRATAVASGTLACKNECGSPPQGLPISAHRDAHAMVQTLRGEESLPSARLPLANRHPFGHVRATALAGFSFRPPFHSIIQGYP